MKDNWGLGILLFLLGCALYDGMNRYFDNTQVQQRTQIQAQNTVIAQQNQELAQDRITITALSTRK